MVKKNNECKVTVDGAARYDFPYFVPIEDGDEVTIKHYKEHHQSCKNSSTFRCFFFRLPESE